MLTWKTKPLFPFPENKGTTIYIHTHTHMQLVVEYLQTLFAAFYKKHTQTHTHSLVVHICLIHETLVWSVTHLLSKLHLLSFSLALALRKKPVTYNTRLILSLTHAFWTLSHKHAWTLQFLVSVCYCHPQDRGFDSSVHDMRDKPTPTHGPMFKKLTNINNQPWIIRGMWREFWWSKSYLFYLF